MKSPVAYYLMLLYLSVLAKPIVPIINDWYSHEFDQIEHLSCIHALYGSHHLQKELTTSGSDDQNKNQSPLRSHEETTFYILKEAFKHDFDFNIQKFSYKLFKTERLPSILLSTQGHPPQQS